MKRKHQSDDEEEDGSSDIITRVVKAARAADAIATDEAWAKRLSELERTWSALYASTIADWRHVTRVCGLGVKGDIRVYYRSILQYYNPDTGTVQWHHTKLEGWPDAMALYLGLAYDTQLITAPAAAAFFAQRQAERALVEDVALTRFMARRAIFDAMSTFYDTTLRPELTSRNKKRVKRAWEEARTTVLEQLEAVAPSPAAPTLGLENLF